MVQWSQNHEVNEPTSDMNRVQEESMYPSRCLDLLSQQEGRCPGCPLHALVGSLKRRQDVCGSQAQARKIDRSRGFLPHDDWIAPLLHGDVRWAMGAGEPVYRGDIEPHAHSA